MKTISYGLLALSLLAGGQVQAAEGRLLPSKPAPGLRAYTYEVAEVVNGKFTQGYRMAFDLQTGPDGAIDALVRAAEATTDAKTWQAVAVSDACKVATHAPSGGLARVRLWPMSPEAAKAMGPAFLDTCAPAGVFFPITDIVNVAVIPLTPTFKVETLKRKGDTAHYEGFNAHYDRAGETLTEITHGGEVSLLSLEGGKVVIDWAPAMADLDLVEKAGGQPVHLVGTEHFAFRVTLNATTGALVEAHTIYDDLDLKAHMAGMPDGVTTPVKISRTVTIKPG